MAPKEESDVAEAEELPAPEQKVYSLQILKIIKEAQQQHGLRHADYQRYRGYCSRRLRRLRQVLKVPQGDRRHFKRRDVVAAMVSDDKFLQIPLTMAERAWSYAMQLRQESNTEPRKKFHLVGRLRKAAVYAMRLKELIENTQCDARTKLESEAYLAYMQGTLSFELQAWPAAMDSFKRAQVVYENLAQALPSHEQLLYKARVDELSPNLRYCAYNIGDESAIDDLVRMRGQLGGELLSNLDALITQTRARQAAATAEEEVTWRGRSCGVPGAKAAALLMAESGLTSALERCAGNEARIEILESHLMDCKDAIAAVREEAKLGDAKQQLIAYLQYVRLSRTLERNLILVKMAEESVKARSQDVVRLYEAALHNLVEMSQLQDGDEEFAREHEAKTRAYRAFRCYHVARSMAGIRRWREAMAMYQRAMQHVEHAVEHESLLPSELRSDLARLRTSIEGAQCAAHAHSVLEEGQEEEESSGGGGGGVASGSGGKQVKSKKPLAERLHEYVEDAALLTKQPNVSQLPAPMRSVPCKPLFFDLAFNMIEFPDLGDKLRQEDKKAAEKGGLAGLVKGLWGWGNK